MTPPSLATLTARFLASKSIASDDGGMAEVMPHEVITSFRADAATTWVDAKSPFSLFGVSIPAMPMPPEWPPFVSQLRDVTVIPFCLGAVPQRMRELSSVTPKLTETKTVVVSGNFPNLMKWVEARRNAGTVGEFLIAAAVLRAMGEFELAENQLNAAESLCTGAFADVLANERAALAWYRGDIAMAASMWNAMGESPVVLFNRGVCEWMLGRPASASKLFDRAAGSIPDRSSWSHLAAFYASLCEG